MKQKLLGMICLVALLLGGCKNAADASTGVAEKYQQPVSAQVRVTAISGVYAEYTLNCTCGEGMSTIELLQPESLCGLKATIDSETCTVQYEGLQLETLMPGVRGYTPVDAFDQMVYSLANEVPTQYEYTEQNGVKAIGLTYESTVGDYACSKMLWLAESSLDLLRAEFFLDGALVMRLEVQSIEWSQPAA